METIIIIAGVLLLILGLLGSVLPVLPGPILGYAALLLLLLLPEPVFTARFLVIWAVVTILVTLLDYVVPVYGTKRLGGSKSGVNGSVIGVVIGFIFLGPLGLIIGPFIGAYLGELIAGKQARVALRSAIGSFIGFLAGTFIKVILVLIMSYHFVNALISYSS